MICITHEELNKAVAAHHNTVFRLAFGCTGNRFDADDITQEAFLRLFMHKKAFENAQHEKAFLIRVTINLSKNLHKSFWHKNRAQLHDAPAPDGETAQEEVLLRECIAQLKPAYRSVIFLYYYEGYSIAETAKLLNISQGNAKMRLSRARSQLKAILLPRA